MLKQNVDTLVQTIGALVALLSFFDFLTFEWGHGWSGIFWATSLRMM
jgi:hypothetical protein